MKDIYTRTITGLILTVAVLGSILLHPLAFFGLFFIFTFFGLNEFFIIGGTNNGRKKNIQYYVFGVFIYSIIGLISLGIIDISFAFLILLVFPLTIIFELFRSKEALWLRAGTYLSAFFYVSVPFGLMNALFLIPGKDGSFPGVLLGMFVIMATSDVAAYLIGSTIGKHRLFERISPKKSWEGSIGGLVFGLVAAWVLSLIYQEMNLIDWMVLAVIIIVTGTLGDLVESLLKRLAGVKDSGNMLPGHGGVLDRFDATLFATPFVFVYINLI